MKIFRNHQWLWFFELLKGFDEEIAREFAVAMQSHLEERATTMVRGLAITLSPELISKVTTFPLGVKWVKERIPSTTCKKSLFLLGEEYTKEKNIVRRESLTYPWE